MQATIILPWPPSVNTYWRNVRGKTIISKAGRLYRKSVEDVLLYQKSIGQPVVEFSNVRLRVEIRAFPPDRRMRDLDNILKAPLDAMQKAGVYNDDSQIDELFVMRGPMIEHGRIQVTISMTEPR